MASLLCFSLNGAADVQISGRRRLRNLYSLEKKIKLVFSYVLRENINNVSKK